MTIKVFSEDRLSLFKYEEASGKRDGFQEKGKSQEGGSRGFYTKSNVIANFISAD